MPWDLRSFDLREMLGCGTQLRRVTHGAPSVEEAAQRVARFFHDELRDAGTVITRQCVMARVYCTQPWRALDDELREFASGLLRGTEPTPDLRCLCLVATAGEEPEWNDRRQSRGHRAIPLTSPEMVEQAPMIAGLARQFGLNPAVLAQPDALMQQSSGKTYGVFHVERARGSPFIPAQRDFVDPYGVQSVVGFGGALRTGDIFAVILFTRVPVSRAAADRFRTLALDVKAALFELDQARIFS